MNTTNRFVATLVLVLSALPTLAQEATSDRWQAVDSVVTRAEVQQQTVAALARGDMDTVRSYDVMPPGWSSALSRAEVLADVQAWRQSGLAAQERGEASRPADPQSQARYDALKAMPEHMALVLNIAHQRGDSLLLAAAAQAADKVTTTGA